MRNDSYFARAVVACALVCAAGDARADFVLFPLGVPARTSGTREVDLAHYVYLPVVGSWIDAGRPGASLSFVLDGLCQNVVDLLFLVQIAGRAERPPVWRVLAWFPESGGGGLSLRATF